MRRIYDKKRFARKRWGKQNYWGGSVRRDNRGMGTVEVILIIVVLVGLVIIFRLSTDQIDFVMVHHVEQQIGVDRIKVANLVKRDMDVGRVIRA